MIVPGRTLHRLAARLCSTQSLERVIEPAIADLQTEYRGRLAHGVVAGGCVLLAGYSAILKVIAICALRMLMPTIEERSAVVRTLKWSLSLIVVVTGALILPPLLALDRSAISLVAFAYFMPQAVPLAIPIGVAFGIALGLANSVSTRATARAVLLSATVAASASCVTMVWVMPTSNQSYREELARNIGVSGPLTEGYAEMSLSELRRAGVVAAAAGDRRAAEESAWFLHTRFALAAAAIAISAFLLTIGVRRAGLRMLVAAFTCFGYWALLHAGEWLAVTTRTISASAGAWLPNILFVSAALLIASTRSSSPRAPLKPAR